MDWEQVTATECTAQAPSLVLLTRTAMTPQSSACMPADAQACLTSSTASVQQTCTSVPGFSRHSQHLQMHCMQSGMQTYNMHDTQTRRCKRHDTSMVHALKALPQLTAESRAAYLRAKVVRMMASPTPVTLQATAGLHGQQIKLKARSLSAQTTTRAAQSLHLRQSAEASAAQQPQPNTAASPTLPGVFMARPPELTPAATWPAACLFRRLCDDEYETGLSGNKQTCLRHRPQWHQQYPAAGWGLPRLALIVRLQLQGGVKCWKLTWAAGQTFI